MAVIEFVLDGKVITVNKNFLKLFGYTIHEVRGHDRSIFADSSSDGVAKGHALWEKLCRGEHDAGQYKKIG